MKFKNIIFLLLVFLCPASAMLAQETSRLSISEKRMQRDTESQLVIEMENIKEIVAVQFTITVPTGFTLNPASAILTDRCADHMVTARYMGGNQYKFAILSSTNTPLKGIKGAIVSVNLKADSNLEEDKDYEIAKKDLNMA